MPRRRKIPTSTETGVLLKSARRCTLCYHLSGDLREKRGQIAHLDGNRANNAEDNLAFMCLDHHSLYDSKTSQHKNYSITEIKRARARLYRAIRNGKHLSIAKGLSNEDRKSRLPKNVRLRLPRPSLQANFDGAPLGPIYLTPEGVWTASYSSSGERWTGLRLIVSNIPIKGKQIGVAQKVSVRVKFRHDTGLDAASAAPTAWLHEKFGHVDLKPGEEKEAIIAVRRASDWYTVTNVRDESGYPPNTAAMHFQPAPWFKGLLHIGVITNGRLIEEDYSWETVDQSIFPKIRKLSSS